MIASRWPRTPELVLRLLVLLEGGRIGQGRGVDVDLGRARPGLGHLNQDRALLGRIALARRP